jgi:hypothetical protein
MDISDLANEVRKRIPGKSFKEALSILALIARPAKVSDLKKRAEENMRQSLRHLFSQVILDDEGLVTGRGPGGISQNEEEVERAIKNEMFYQALIFRELNAQAYIETARHIIANEHIISTGQLLPFVTNNPFVPQGRELIYAQGLHAGLMGDLTVAAHLLIPQLENSLRYLLEQKGVSTSAFDDEGIQDVYPLTKILYPPFSSTLEEILGKDLVFDLKGLLVERFGANLRNRMAHGRISQQGYASVQVLYLWWIVLHLCFIPLSSY